MTPILFSPETRNTKVEKEKSTTEMKIAKNEKRQRHHHNNRNNFVGLKNKPAKHVLYAQQRISYSLWHTVGISGEEHARDKLNELKERLRLLLPLVGEHDYLLPTKEPPTTNWAIEVETNAVTYLVPADTLRGNQFIVTKSGQTIIELND
uniref:Uncharacterized protein n=1 Tax=Glossina austeni TaxID=7395 RepID=A0A1A9UZ82_GLOAU